MDIGSYSRYGTSYSPTNRDTNNGSKANSTGNRQQSVSNTLRQIADLLPDIVSSLGPSPQQLPDGPGPNPGEILGGTNAIGGNIDPVNADFTRNGGTEPQVEVGLENLGTTESGLTRVRVSLENQNAEDGTYFTPAFVGASNGEFDLFTVGESASPGLEALAEDGAAETLTEEFNAATNGNGVSGVLASSEGGPFAPGSSGELILELDPTQHRYLSFGQMVLPSNDMFLGSGDDPRAIEIFDDNGNFTGASAITFDGNRIYDAGTEVNTEMDAAFINQTDPNTGETENGIVQQSPGFIGSERQIASSNQELGQRLTDLINQLADKLENNRQYS